MSLSSLYLDAFVAVAQTASFSKAASQLHVTQSALSQRIKNLEEDLGITLFLRTSSGAVLTSQGERLLRYCQTRESLESELTNDLNVGSQFELSGTLRIGTYSSVLRSVVIPALSPLLRLHPNLLCEFSVKNMEELPQLLQRAEVDFIIMDKVMQKAGIETEILGEESFIVIQSKKDQGRDDIYLDNDALDSATTDFFAAQKVNPPKFRRSYFDDCYGIIEGVEQGLGRAIMSAHLIHKNSKLKMVKGFKSYKRPVTLHYYHQPFYSKLHQAVRERLVAHCQKYL